MLHHLSKSCVSISTPLCFLILTTTAVPSSSVPPPATPDEDSPAAIAAYYDSLNPKTRALALPLTCCRKTNSTKIFKENETQATDVPCTWARDNYSTKLYCRSVAAAKKADQAAIIGACASIAVVLIVALISVCQYCARKRRVNTVMQFSQPQTTTQFQGQPPYQSGPAQAPYAPGQYQQQPVIASQYQYTNSGYKS